MALLIVLLTIIVLDMASQHWGVVSTDGMNSLEWLRRQRCHTKFCVMVHNRKAWKPGLDCV